MSGPTYEQWIKELDNAAEPCNDAFTALEWAEKLSLSRDGAQKWVKNGLAGGWLAMGRIKRTTISGITKSLVGFALQGKPNATPRSRHARVPARRK